MVYDVLFYNGSIYSTAYRRFFPGFFTLKDGKFAYMGDGEPDASVEAAVKVDLKGKRVVPGLIDIHTHIESSMITPMAFAREESRHGITTIVCEPHEIANVAGVPGVLAMMEAGEGAPCDIYYGIPSSVPASSPELETTGGVIGVEELKALAQHPRVRCLGEVMNQNSVIDEPDGVINALIQEFIAQRPELPVEGHCPKAMGERLAKYIFNGIDSDHTEHSFEEYVARYRMGVQVQLQEKSIKKDLIDHIVENSLFDATAIVTDDIMPDELLEHGALDHVLREAVKAGYPFEQAVFSSTKVPAVRMRFFDRGEIRPGYLADFVVIEDDEIFEPLEVYLRGKQVYHKGLERERGRCDFPQEFYNSVKLAPITLDDFSLKAQGDSVTARTIEVHHYNTHTAEVHSVLPVVDGEVQFGGDTGVLLAVVFERYGINSSKGYGFITGDAHKKGAVAATYCHDHHNLFVAGENKEDMLLAAERVREMGGGFAIAHEGRLLAEVPLPVGGIMSDLSALETGEAISEVTRAMLRLGYNHVDPIMSFCTIPLTVSPALKISDKGLVDVAAGKLVSTFID